MHHTTGGGEEKTEPESDVKSFIALSLNPLRSSKSELIKFSPANLVEIWLFSADWKCCWKAQVRVRDCSKAVFSFGWAMPESDVILFWCLFEGAWTWSQRKHRWRSVSVGLKKVVSPRLYSLVKHSKECNSWSLSCSCIMLHLAVCPRHLRRYLTKCPWATHWTWRLRLAVWMVDSFNVVAA